MTMTKYMAIDQYGNAYRGLEHPRKDLMDRLGCKHSESMYADSEDGKTYRVGYVISGLWLTVYEVSPMRKEI